MNLIIEKGKYTPREIVDMLIQLQKLIEEQPALATQINNVLAGEEISTVGELIGEKGAYALLSAAQKTGGEMSEANQADVDECGALLAALFSELATNTDSTQQRLLGP